MRPCTRADGTELYEYILLYTDNCLGVSDKAEGILKDEIGKYFELKPDSIGPPKVYLGGRLRKVKLESGVEAWDFGSSQYVQSAVRNVEECLKRKGESLKAKALEPLPKGYRPEIDISPELGPAEASYYSSLTA